MKGPLADPIAWRRLSSSLDDLLDADTADRDDRLRRLRTHDPAMAEDLSALLARLPGLDADPFLAEPALPPPEGLAGQRVGAYELLHEIGRGGMGCVWLARRADGRFQGQVAIKFMRGGLLARSATDRFLREGELLARLNHPHIARLLDAGVLSSGVAGDVQPYLVLEHVDGQPIDRHCEAQALDVRARVRLMLDVLDAVDHAHSRLILHRDLKPSNILVTGDGQVKLLDFGIGKLLDGAGEPPPGAPDATAEPTQVAFTMPSAAPEQVQRHEVTTATDVYALGVLLYGLLGGGHPTATPGDPPFSQMRAVLETVPPPLSDAVRRLGAPGARRLARTLRGDMDTIVARALKKDPAERYPNAAALAADLRRWLHHEPVEARRDGLGYRAGRFLRRHRPAVTAAATAGILALFGGSAVAWWQAQRASAERGEAEALVAFMLDDLQPRLNALGRTDLLQAVGERALAYYRADRLQSMDDTALRHHARALLAIGESARQRADLGQARTALDRAAATTRRLLDLAPTDIQRLQDHAASLERLVELGEGHEDDATVLALCRDISALRWRAAGLAPEDRALRLQALMGDQWPMGFLVHQQPDDELFAHLERIDGELRLLPDDLPGVGRARAVAKALTGQALLLAGRNAQAETVLRAALADQPTRHGAVADAWERHENVMIRSSLVSALIQQGRLDDAIAVAREGLAGAEANARTVVDQGNRILDRQLVGSRILLGDLLWLAGDRAGARAQMDAIDAALDRGGRVPDADVDWHIDVLGKAAVLRARVRTATGPAGAPVDPRVLGALQAHADHLARREADGRTLGRRLSLVTLPVAQAHGDALQAAGRPADAAHRWRWVVERARPFAEQGHHRAMARLASAQLSLGQADQARPWIVRLRDDGWRHPDLAVLERRLARAETAPATAHTP